MRSSVGVIGQKGRLGLSEKVVLLNGKICVLKRFNKVSIKRGEFGRRIVRFGLVSSECKYIVPIHAYFYAKRIKFVVCQYYPMGSLADLLTSKFPSFYSICFSMIFFTFYILACMHSIYSLPLILQLAGYVGMTHPYYLLFVMPQTLHIFEFLL